MKKITMLTALSLILLLSSSVEIHAMKKNSRKVPASNVHDTFIDAGDNLPESPLTSLKTEHPDIKGTVTLTLKTDEIAPEKSTGEDLLSLVEKIVIPEGSSKGFLSSKGPGFECAWNNAVSEFEKSKSKAGEAEKARIDFLVNRNLAVHEENRKHKLPVILSTTPSLTDLDGAEDCLKGAIRANRPRYAAIADVVRKSEEVKLSFNPAELEKQQALFVLSFKQLTELIGIQFQSFLQQIGDVSAKLDNIDALLKAQKAGYIVPKRPCDTKDPHALLDLALKLAMNLRKEEPKPAAIPESSATSSATESTEKKAS